MVDGKQIRHERLWLSQLRTDFQPHENLAEEIVEKYMQQIADGEALTSIMVRFDGKSYFVEDGFHRVEAARRCGCRKLNAVIAPGTLDELKRKWREGMEEVKANLRKGSGLE
jgi:hypothetical protein